MGLKFDLLTRADVEAGGPAFFAPGGDSVTLMARETWEMIRTNPSLPADCPVAATLSRDNVRGATITLAHHPIVCNGSKITTVWGHGLLAHPKLRAFGFGGLLVRELIPKLAKRGVLFAALGPTPEAARLLAAVGMMHVGLLPRYILPLRVNPILRHFLGAHALSDNLSAALNLARSAWVALRRRALASGNPRLEMRECEFLEDAAIPPALAKDERVRLEHTAALVNWRLRFARSIKGTSGRVFVLTDSSGAPAGYFVARVATHAFAGGRRFRDVRIFRVLDLVAPGAVASALYHVLRAARGCDVVEIISSCENTIGTCHQAGFIESNGYDFLVGRMEGTPPRILDRSEWFLNLLEAEAAFYSG